MTQKDYILRVAEDVGRALAQIIYHNWNEHSFGLLKDEWKAS
jgi:hypothetical protein